MRVSVVIPVYNGAKYIRSAIRSVLRQSYSAYEIIVVDDASTDATAEILSEFGDRIVVLTNEKNIERSLSRNRAIDYASGDFVAFLDADDVFMRDHLKGLVDACKPDHDIVYSYTRYTGLPLDEHYDRVRRLEAFEPEHHLYRYNLKIQASMVRVSMIRESGILFDSRFRVAEDILFFCQLIVKGARIKFVPRLSVFIRQHDENTTVDRVKSCYDSFAAVEYLGRWSEENAASVHHQKLLRLGRSNSRLFYYLYSLKDGGEYAVEKPRKELFKLFFSPMAVIGRIRCVLGMVWPYFPFSNHSKVLNIVFGQLK